MHIDPWTNNMALTRTNFPVDIFNKLAPPQVKPPQVKIKLHFFVTIQKGNPSLKLHEKALIFSGFRFVGIQVSVPAFIKFPPKNGFLAMPYNFPTGQCERFNFKKKTPKKPTQKSNCNYSRVCHYQINMSALLLTLCHFTHKHCNTL